MEHGALDPGGMRDRMRRAWARGGVGGSHSGRFGHVLP
jgi:hypothetical protein